MHVIPGTAGDTTFDRRPDIDLIDGNTYAGDVHAALRWMRAHEPFYHDRANDLWAVTRHADVMAISKASNAFRNGRGFRPDSGPMPMMISLDRPEHMTRRNLVNRGFTPRHVITGGMHQLLLHPEQFAALRNDPGKLELAVEEMLRWVTPIQNMLRTVAEATEVSGHRFEAGQRLLLMYGSANRDEAIFDEPYRFDISRDPNPHVAFGGYGSHFCLGNALARLELRVLFEETLRRLPDLHLASDAVPTLRPANFVVGIESLPVAFTPVARELGAR